MIVDERQRQNPSLKKNVDGIAAAVFFVCLEVTLFFIPWDLCQSHKVCISDHLSKGKKSHMATTKNKGERDQIRFTINTAYLFI